MAKYENHTKIKTTQTLFLTYQFIQFARHKCFSKKLSKNF